MATQRFTLTFNKQQTGSPIIYNLGKKFRVIPVIERANVTEEAGWMTIAFNGDPDEIGRAVADLHTLGISVTGADLATMG